MNYYPLFIFLQDKPCVVVGGGRVAERKIAALLSAGAKLAVISPQCTEQIRKWVEEGKVKWEARNFQGEDIAGATIVIAATDNPTINMEVYQSIGPGQWINMVDRPDLCTFIVPSIVRRGDLTIAISTGGNYPGLSKKLRQEMEAWIGDEYEEYTAFLGEVRRKIHSFSLDRKEKQELLSALLDERFKEWTRTQNYKQRDTEVQKLLDQYC